MDRVEPPVSSKSEEVAAMLDRFLGGLYHHSTQCLTQSPRKCVRATTVTIALSEKLISSSAFFALLASVMIPANLPVQLFLFVSIRRSRRRSRMSYTVRYQVIATVIVGMCLGWSLGAAAMRAALASRNQLFLKESLQREMQRCFKSPRSSPFVVLPADLHVSALRGWPTLRPCSKRTFSQASS